jgi:hypothetical protein
MKKRIITEPMTETVNLGDVSLEKYYGFVNEVGQRGFITRQRWHDGEFLAISFYSITNGNSFGARSELPELISELMMKGFSVFQFGECFELLDFLYRDKHSTGQKVKFD